MILFALTIVVMLFKKERNSTESFISSVVPAQPTKCFSCENQLPSNKKYLSGPSKCFSCEEDLLKRNPPSLPGLGQSSKCFSCERQMI
tara:strand:+ start:96 stop:359 length:264 start_codon:yes stop_codon:yes gene_type:complete